MTLNSHFTGSGERHVDILVHLVQRLEKLVEFSFCTDPWLVGRLHVLMLQSVRAAVRGFPEGMPVWTVIGARPLSGREGELLMMLWMAGTELCQSASGVSVSELKRMHHTKHFLANGFDGAV